MALSTGTETSQVAFIRLPSGQGPQLVARVAIGGPINDSRLVGDMLYVVARSGSLFQSIDVSDPSSRRLVDILALPESAYGYHVHATDKIFFVANTPHQTLGECGAAQRHDIEGCTATTAID